MDSHSSNYLTEDDIKIDTAKDRNVHIVQSNNVTILSQDQLNNLDKEQLVSKVISMQENIKQLKCIILKQQQQSQNGNSRMKVNKKPNRQFDFTRYKLRHIFVKFLYLGWNYDGFVVQDDTLNTVETALFEALLKTKLIRSRETANYHRCGRTDKGVSAFCQVVSLTVRSQMRQAHGVFAPDDYSVSDDSEIINTSDLTDIANKEIDYISALNGVLPKDIRVIAWAPIENTTVSARFDCKHRRYHYYFPRGQLDIARMNEACQYLLGEHDFRNLCKMDINNGVVNYVRKVHFSSVCPLIDLAETINPYSICLFQIESSAFLWHQIRCIMGVLFLVGQGLEEPSVISRLLNVQDNPSKPQYSLAADLPLVLYAAHYDASQVPKWTYGRSDAALKAVIGQLHEEWAKKTIQATIVKSMIDSLTETYNEQFEEKLQFDQVNSHLKVFLSGIQSRVYKPLFQRPLCDSLESRLEKKQSKKRIKLTN